MSPKDLQFRLARTKNIEKRIALQDKLANVLLDRNLDAAERVTLSMLDESLKCSHLKGIALARMRVGQITFLKGQPKECFEILASVKEYFKSVGDKANEAETTLSMGYFYKAVDNFTLSLSFALEAANIQKEIKLWQGYARSLNLLASIYNSVSDYESALSHATEGLEIAQTLNSEKLEAAFLSTIAGLYDGVGNYDQAIAYELASLRLHKLDGDSAWTAGNLVSLSHYYSQMNLWSEALPYALESLDLLLNIGNKEGELICYQNLANIYCETGEMDLSEKYLHKAFKLSEGRGDRHNYRHALSIQAKLLWRCGNLPESKASYIETHKLFDGFESLSTNIRVLTELILVSKEQNDFSTASQYEKTLTELQTHERKQRYEKDFQLRALQTQVAQVQRELDLQSEQIEQTTAAFEEQTVILSELTKELSLNRAFLKALRDDLVRLEYEDPLNVQLKRVRNKVEKELKSSNHLEHINHLLEQVHPDFARRLSSAFPTLSKTEHHVCIFLKLNLQTSEIARLLKVSERTIEVHRAHIRKKMKLNSTDSLAERLHQLVESN